MSAVANVGEKDEWTMRDVVLITLYDYVKDVERAVTLSSAVRYPITQMGGSCYSRGFIGNEA
eukprot:4416745-Prymnesium_polylepis.2